MGLIEEVILIVFITVLVFFAGWFVRGYLDELIDRRKQELEAEFTEQYHDGNCDE